jgi:hypothetical protein
MSDKDDDKKKQDTNPTRSTKPRSLFVISYLARADRVSVELRTALARNVALAYSAGRCHW